MTEPVIRFVPDPAEITYVVAINFQHFRLWQRERGYPSSILRYVSGVDQLKGLRDVPVLFLEGWQNRLDAHGIYEAAHRVMRRPQP